MEAGKCRKELVEQHNEFRKGHKRWAEEGKRRVVEVEVAASYATIVAYAPSLIVEDDSLPGGSEDVEGIESQEGCHLRLMGLVDQRNRVWT